MDTLAVFVVMLFMTQIVWQALLRSEQDALSNHLLLPLLLQGVPEK
jgi:hypothetical protein